MADIRQRWKHAHIQTHSTSVRFFFYMWDVWKNGPLENERTLDENEADFKEGMN